MKLRGDNMQRFQIIYDENKKLDQMFNSLYSVSEKDIVRKNKLELLVELGELANETRCFKYWSNKGVNNELVFEEYADCIIMVLCFFNMMNIDFNESFDYDKMACDNVDLIGYLYKLCSMFYEKEDRNLIKEIFLRFIYLGYNLGMDDSDIIDACLKKIDKNKERFKDGF